MKPLARIALASLVAPAAVAAAQGQLKPRPLGDIKAISKETVGLVNGLRQLPDGSILVNDVGRRRLLLIDSTLQGSVVIADTAAGAPNMYAQQGGSLMPYVGDSTLFLDLAAQSFLVIDPHGKIAHVMAVPRSNDMFSLMTGFPGFDAQGRMVYRTNFPRQILRTADGGMQAGPAPDSQPVIRVNLETRRVDTIGTVKVAKLLQVSQTTSSGMTMMRMVPPPFPLIDDWAVLENGAVAFVRGQDYHVDWIMADGSKATTGKQEFPWKRLSDDDKIALVDSITNARSQPSSGPAGGAAPTMMFGGDGAGVSRMIVGGDGGGGGRGSVMMGAPAPAAGPMMIGGGAGASSAAPASATSSTSTSASGAASSGAASSGAASGTGSSSAATGPANAANAAATNANRAPANGATVAQSSSGTGAASSTAASADAAGPIPPTVKGRVESGAAPAAASRAGAEVDRMVGIVGGMGSLPPLPTPAAADLPDYLPPFRVGVIRADRDANIWIATSAAASAPGNVIYDVINSKGELADRIEIPKGYAIVGFGHGGVIYMTHRENAALKIVSAKR